MNNTTLLQVNFTEAENEIASIREQVFVQELKIPQRLEWDGRDNTACHIIAKHHEFGVVACGRLLPDAHIGRIAVLLKWRNKGIGSKLLNELCTLAASKKYPAVYLSAQNTALAFYQYHGFTVTGDSFITVGINHSPMTKHI